MLNDTKRQVINLWNCCIWLVDLFELCVFPLNVSTQAAYEDRKVFSFLFHSSSCVSFYFFSVITCISFLSFFFLLILTTEVFIKVVEIVWWNTLMGTKPGYSEEKSYFQRPVTQFYNWELYVLWDVGDILKNTAVSRPVESGWPQEIKHRPNLDASV